jgi:hypothetical protein
MRIPNPSNIQRQGGAATLAVAMVLLIAVTLLTLMSSRTTIMEQRMAANEVRARQAFEAAQAGLDKALDHLSAPGSARSFDANADGTIDSHAATLYTSGPSYKSTYCATLPTACPARTGTLSCGSTLATDARAGLIFSCGWSDDGTATHAVSQYVDLGDAMTNPPQNPLIAKGTVDVTGSATVTNYFNNLTIWTGNSLTNIGNSGKTFVRNPTVTTPESTPPGPPSSCSTSTDYVCNTDKTKTGPDVIANDTSLSSLSEDAYFQNFFGTTPAEYQQRYATHIVAPDTNLDGRTNQIIWITGDHSFGAGQTIGTRDDPVIVIVDGNATASGTPTLYGVLFVMDNFNAAGNLTVYGSAVIDGNVSGTGSLDIIYDPVAAGGAAQLGTAGSLAGSWRDWL